MRRVRPVPRHPPPPCPPGTAASPLVCRCAPAAPGGRGGCPGRGRRAVPGARTAPSGFPPPDDRPLVDPPPVDPLPVDPVLPGPAGRLVVLLGLGRPEREVPDAGPLDAPAPDAEPPPPVPVPVPAGLSAGGGVRLGRSPAPITVPPPCRLRADMALSRLKPCAVCWPPRTVPRAPRTARRPAAPAAPRVSALSREVLVPGITGACLSRISGVHAASSIAAQAITISPRFLAIPSPVIAVDAAAIAIATPSRKNNNALENTIPMNNRGIRHADSRCRAVMIHTQPTANTAEAR